jgi:hypothetical protein
LRKRVARHPEANNVMQPALYAFLRAWTSGEAMRTRQTLLRGLVEKWLGPDPEGRARVTRFNASTNHPWRYVRVELTRRSGDLSIIFFRHDDGSWCLFPPEKKRPAMSVARISALPCVDVAVEVQCQAV